ncbi:RING-type E3 ubiquitin transferase [Caerostris darwini]|uniref:RING-type E3 ubiquitin transferase n=1 Tax=Caerostris darwini TaxID=1538125 RepID=A0AAV4P249_9ARAC|nr:RING-type E3 ubiquitin transferase [Caerostris darwini]
MDLEKILEAGAAIGINVFLCVFSHKLYVDKTKCLNNLKEAQHLELNRETAQKVEDSGGTIPYAVISGKVKALTAPLRSEHLSSLRGVMQESIISEYKVRWVSSLNIWGPVNNNINRKIANVPFSLVGKSGLFQKTVSVEIGDPFSAQELVLSEVFNDYSKYDESLGEALKGFFSSEHIVGISQVENMLLENTSLTAIDLCQLLPVTLKLF